jgi:ABC-2 type transport system permease protein
MPGNSAFTLVQARGWRGGLRNLLQAENGKWWRSRRWWVNTLIAIGIIDLIMASAVLSSESTLSMGIQLYTIFTGLGPAIAIVIIMQDVIVGEKESGTAAWILSKPVSRASFVLSKLAANSLGILVTMLLVPGILAYIIIGLGTKTWLNPLLFLAGMGALLVYLLYYMSLTLMLGTFFHNRGPVTGIALAWLFSQQFFSGKLAPQINFLPWALAISLGGNNSSVAAAIMEGQTPPLIALYVSLLSIAVFVAASLWRFSKEEL